MYLASCFPSVVLGANVTTPTDFGGLVGLFIDIIQKLIAFVFALTFIVFVWGIAKGWIINGGQAEGVESGKNTFLVGVVVLAIMVSIWGILALLQNSVFGGGL